MKTLLAVVAVLMASHDSTGIPLPPLAKPHFVGDWVLVSVQKSDKLERMVDRRGHHEVWRLSTSKLKIAHLTDGDRKEEEFEVSVGRDGPPFSIDISLSSGVCHAIFCVDGNKLSVCMSGNLAKNTPESRPRTMQASSRIDGAGEVVLRFERIPAK